MKIELLQLLPDNIFIFYEKLNIFHRFKYIFDILFIIKSAFVNNGLFSVIVFHTSINVINPDDYMTKYWYNAKPIG